MLEQCGPLYTSETGEASLSISLKNPQKDHYLVAIEGVTDRNGAESLRGTELWINKDTRPETEEDEFYYDDLIGLTVFDEQNKESGKIITVEDFGAGPLIEIKPETGESFYLPFADEYILQVDKNARKIVAVIPDEFING